MDAILQNAREAMKEFVNPKDFDDKFIPHAILKNAKGIAIFSEVRAGFILSGMMGRGIFLARKKGAERGWSGPIALGTGGIAFGAQIGGVKTDAMIIMNSESAIKAFAGGSQIKLGGDFSIAAGPVGRRAAADVRVGEGMGFAACYSYSHSAGLFVGVALEGAILTTLDDENQKFYGLDHKVSPQDILFGDVKPPHNVDLEFIYDTLNQFSFEEETREKTATNPHPAHYHVHRVDDFVGGDQNRQ